MDTQTSEKKIEYWEDQLKKTKEEDQSIKPFLGYSELVGFSDLRMLDEGFAIDMVVGDKKLSWGNHGEFKYHVRVEKVKLNCDYVHVYSKGINRFTGCSYDSWNFTKIKYLLISLILSYYKMPENYSTRLVDGLKTAVSLISNAENILNQ